MAKKNMAKLFMTFGVLALTVLGIFAGLKYLGVFTLPGQEALEEQVEDLKEEVDEAVAAGICPDTMQTSVTFTLKNDEDETQDDTFDATGYLYKVEEGDVTTYDQSITDTTAGSTNLDCNQPYILRLVSADGDGGDNAKIDRIVSAKNAEILEGGKAVKFTPLGRSYTLKMGGERHGVLEFRAYDNNNNGYMCDSDDSCTAWETDGVTFESTTNGTALAVGSGECIDITQEFRSTNTSTSFDDFGYLILLEGGASANTIWDVPDTASVNGKVYEDEMGLLDEHEAKQYNDYEYVYIVDDHDVVRTKNRFNLEWCANAGQDPTADIEIDYAPRGAYLSIDGSTVKYGAAKDDTSKTVVFAVQDTGVDLS
jgi:hypothetical protein